jgi:uncharacterized repeat protein (TIGR03806 family)
MKFATIHFLAGYALLLACPSSTLSADDGAAENGAAENGAAAGLEPRPPWTTSHVIGSPEPPLPFTTMPFLAKVAWKQPIYIEAEPGGDTLLVIEAGGEAENPSRIRRVESRDDAKSAETILEIEGRLIYGLTFAPDYARSGLLYLFSNGPRSAETKTNRISSVVVQRDGDRRANVASEKVIIEWTSNGHDGGDLVFGNDGMLYVTTGDGTVDSDTNVTGQDIRDLQGGVLRMDVSRADGERPYTIPADNPFVGRKDARGEIWAFGLRNPWRMCVDRVSGQIWVGNNGQDLWETAHLLLRGANYGWSVYEGHHPFYLNRELGPAPFVPPTVEHHHREARSLTGGVVYRGKKLPRLDGVYVYGDYSTGKIWGAKHDGERLTFHEELLDTTIQIAGFGVTRGGDLIVVDHRNSLHRVVPATMKRRQASFPKRLSETGIFASVAEHRVAPGVVAYEVNAPGWFDGADAVRFVGLPGDAKIVHSEQRGWGFPDGAVLVQTLTLPESGRRIETRLLTRQEGEWLGYSYLWNVEQTDATLVHKDGAEISLTSTRAGGTPRTWAVPSRTECVTCHSRAVNYVLGLSDEQMNREHDYGGVTANQIEAFVKMSIFKKPPQKPAAELPKAVDPHLESNDLAARARSYLHVNCSSCHVEAGGGNANMELELEKTLVEMRTVEARPRHETFGLPDAMLIAPASPQRSVVHERMSRRGRGQMPPLGTSVVDERGVRLIARWIETLKPTREFVRAWTMDDLRPRLAEVGRGRKFDSGESAFRDLGCHSCHRFAGKGAGAGPSLVGIGVRVKRAELLESLVAPSKKVAREFATTVIITTKGDVIEGRIQREDERTIVLRSSGFLAKPLTILKAAVARRTISGTSMMPVGMLDTLEAAQVLDLLAYLIADGKDSAAAFE